MFRKVLDKIKSANIDKLRRDAEIQAKRLKFNANSLKADLKTNWSTSRLYKNFPNAKSFTSLLSQKPSLDSLDKKSTEKLDSMNKSLNNKLASTTKSLKSLANSAKGLPSLFASSLKNFKSDSKSYVSESFSEGKSHISKYFSDNKKYFDNLKSKSARLASKSKAKLLFLCGGAIFIYAVGSNIPNAIVAYRLAKESQTSK